MAHVEKRGKNSYRIIISLGKDPVTGKYRYYRETIKAKNKREAEKKAIEIEARILKGDYIKPDNITVEEYLNQWLENSSFNLKETTLNNYKIIINAHIIPELGKISLQKLQPIHIQNYILKKLKSGRRDGKGGLSNRSVRYHYTILREALDAAVKLQLIDKNPAVAIEPPKVEKKEMKALNQKEIDKLLETALEMYDYTTYAIIFIAIYTGMRRGEILGLSWDHVDLDDASLRVEQTLLKGPEGSKLYTPKTEQSRRTIFLTKTTVEVLEKLKKEQAINKLKLGPAYNNEYNLVFVNADGSIITPDAFKNRFTRIRKKAGLNNIRFHDLRHTHATMMLQAGISHKEAAERLGHSTITTTVDLYTHVTEPLKRRVVDKLERMTR
ncbi:hypothetical protein BBF96_03235 [Anoxybacter fermentans]|uniref:Integrase n=1 Tax=Anoxybacter fermentans TaxID=1323375 RepID=A0A3Q9HTC5_9FIRM|nr:hypothetical protein BBF96_03235 [Anoxybacter fermentans]